MNIVIHPTLALFEQVHQERLRPRFRIQRIQELILENNPFWTPLWNELSNIKGFRPAEAACADSYYAIRGHQVWGAMNPLNTSDLHLENIAKLMSIDWEAFIEEALNDYPLKFQGDLEVFLIPGDPHNPYFMVLEEGLSISALVPGKIMIAIWPHASTLARLKRRISGEIHANQVLQNHPFHENSDLIDYWCFNALRYLHAMDTDKAQLKLDLCAHVGQTEFEQIPCNIFGPLEDFSAFILQNPPLPDEAQVQFFLEAYQNSADVHTIGAFLYGDPYMEKVGFQKEGFPKYFGTKLGAELLAPNLGEEYRSLKEILLRYIKN